MRPPCRPTSRAKGRNPRSIPRSLRATIRPQLPRRRPKANAMRPVRMRANSFSPRFTPRRLPPSPQRLKWRLREDGPGLCRDGARDGQKVMRIKLLGSGDATRRTLPVERSLHGRDVQVRGSLVRRAMSPGDLVTSQTHHRSSTPEDNSCSVSPRSRAREGRF